MQNRLNSAYQFILFFLREREREREKRRRETILFTLFNSLIIKLLGTFLTREFICKFVRCLEFDFNIRDRVDKINEVASIHHCRINS